MKSLFPILATAACLVSVAIPVLAGPPAASPAPVAKAAAKKTPFVCPVTNEKVDDIAKASGKSAYKGKTYYFCCAGCKPAFDKNPAKYVKADVKPAPAKGAKPAAKPAPKKA